MNGCAPGLALIERLKVTRKWAIPNLILAVITPHIYGEKMSEIDFSTCLVVWSIFIGSGF